MAGTHQLPISAEGNTVQGQQLGRLALWPRRGCVHSWHVRPPAKEDSGKGLCRRCETSNAIEITSLPGFGPCGSKLARRVAAITSLLDDLLAGDCFRILIRQSRVKPPKAFGSSVGIKVFVTGSRSFLFGRELGHAGQQVQPGPYPLTGHTSKGKVRLTSLPWPQRCNHWRPSRRPYLPFPRFGKERTPGMLAIQIRPRKDVGHRQEPSGRRHACAGELSQIPAHRGVVKGHRQRVEHGSDLAADDFDAGLGANDREKSPMAWLGGRLGAILGFDFEDLGRLVAVDAILPWRVWIRILGLPGLQFVLARRTIRPTKTRACRRNCSTSSNRRAVKWRRPLRPEAFDS